MRGATFEQDTDSNYKYIDPTPFLDPVYPVPVWDEECSDFTIKMFGQVSLVCKALCIVPKAREPAAYIDYLPTVPDVHLS